MPTLNLADLKVGYEFEPIEFTVSDQEAEDYKSATGGESEPSALQSIIHPLHIDAIAIANLLNQLGIVEERIETVHAGQQMTVSATVKPGATVKCSSTLKSNNLRRNSRWATITSTFSGPDGELIAESSSTLIILPNET